MKKNMLIYIVLSSMVILSGCVSNNTANNTISNNNTGNTTQDAPQKKSLNLEQKDSLIYLIQEEKLARDIYMIMYNIWGVKKFYNILNAEENHQALVADILEIYGVQNPNIDKELGQFENSELASLYTTLAEKGKISNKEAIGAGVIIEEKDIADIQNMMKLFTGYNDIQGVLQKLLEGSQRHLQAFKK